MNEKETFSTRAKNRAADLQLSQSEISRRIGVSQPTVNAWLNGDVKTVRFENAEKLAKVLNTTADWLMYGDGQQVSSSESRKEILFGRYKLFMDEPTFVEERKLEIGFVSSIPDLKAVRVANNSLEPVLNADDIVLLDTNIKDIDNGSIYALFVGDRFVIVFLSVSLTGAVTVSTLNPKETITLNDPPKIIGKVILRISKT